MLATPRATDAPVSQDRWKIVGVCLGLVLLVLLIFGQAARYEFIAFDDDKYVNHNPALTAGLSARGLVWAFTTNLTRLSATAEYWQPLTSLTRLADYQCSGFAPGGHHATSVFIHLATGLALFGALRRLTGALWRSAFVATLFLVHPMHVEPVLWISARKDLVNALFYVLTLWAYAWYAARPGWRRYLLVFAGALAANMGKPMAVSLPFVLFLLDVWPLRRVAVGEPGWGRRLAKLAGEKAPLLALTFGVAALAFVVQREIGAMAGADVLPLPWRLANAAVAVMTYVGKAFVPMDLAFFYPHPGKDLSVWRAGASACAVLAVSWLAWREVRVRPWLLVGWGWFLVMLGPVVGIIQIGEQALADRYSYLAHVGLFIAVVWQFAEWVERSRGAETPAKLRAAWALAIGVVAAFSIASFFQVSTWRSSETVFRQALAVTANNYVAHYNLGAVLWDKGERAEALPHFQKAAQIREPFLRFQLAAAEEALQRDAYGEAIPRLTRVLMITPWNADLHYELGSVLILNREPGKALLEFDQALKFRPDWIQPRLSIAAVLLVEGQAQKAEKILREVIVRDPGNEDARALLEKVPPPR